tara:strand:+ start:757 stop:1890 length:1134 start_codon:yes stop_codon:yes gene_type:complete
MKYLLNLPNITSLEKKYVNKAISSNWISVNGKFNKLFEKEFGKIVKKKFNIGVQSGTAALHLAIKSMGITNKDFVVTPNYSCSANISSISQCNAKALIVEVEKDTLGIDYDSLKLAINKYKPKIVQLVHIYGFPARDTFKIVKLCRKKNIKIIEDVSEAIGSTLNKRYVGSFGDITITSIRSEKLLGVGEGAVISTNDKKIFDRIDLLANRNMPFRGGKDPYWKKYISKGEGYNYLMPHLLGAFGYAQIKNFRKNLRKKIRIGKTYRTVFKNYNFAQKVVKNSKPVFWLNHIYLKNLPTNKIRKLGNYLIKNGIEIRSGFWPLYYTPNIIKKYVSINNRNFSNKLFEKIVVLPSNINLKLKDIQYIKYKIDKYLKNN